MARKNFNLLHSLTGLLVLLCVEGGLLWYGGGSLVNLNPLAVILFCAFGGGAFIVVLAAEVIEEVRNAKHMLILLSAVMFEYIVFFAFQYYFLEVVEPQSFPNLALEPVSLLLHSTMVFVFNPLWVPATSVGRGLLLINTAGALILVLFIVQNIWQFRSHGKNAL